MFKKLFGKKPASKETQVENPFALFATYLNNLKANIDDDNATYDNLRESSFLISNEYGEQVEQYNRNTASFFNLPKIERHIECTGDSENEICTHTLGYRDKSLSWQEIPNLVSDDFEIFMMSKLIAGDIEIRFDVCSTGLSDHDYYALMPEIWQQFEEKYGLEFVRNHFEPMGTEFCEPNYKFELIASNL